MSQVSGELQVGTGCAEWVWEGPLLECSPVEPGMPAHGEHHCVKECFFPPRAPGKQHTSFLCPELSTLSNPGNAPRRRTWGEDGSTGQGHEVLSPSTILDKAKGVEADCSTGSVWGPPITSWSSHPRTLAEVWPLSLLMDLGALMPSWGPLLQGGSLMNIGVFLPWSRNASRKPQGLKIWDSKGLAVGRASDFSPVLTKRKREHKWALLVLVLEGHLEGLWEGREIRFLICLKSDGKRRTWKKHISSLLPEACSGSPRPAPHLQEGGSHLGTASPDPSDLPQWLR